MKKLYSLALGLLATLGLSAQVTIGETNYETLQAAIDAAEAGATLTITSDVTITSRLGIGKNLTLEAVNGAKIIVGSNFDSSRILINNSANATLSNVTIDGGGFETNRTIVEIAQQAASVNLSNVTIQNVSLKAGRIILVKKPTVVENLKFENCTCAAGSYPILVGGNGMTVKGTGEYDLYVEGTYTMSAEDFTGKIGIELQNWSERTIVNNGNVANFYLVGAPEGYKLADNNGSVGVIYEKDVVTNETTGVSYSSLIAAVDAASTNDVITILEDIELPGRLLIGYKNITLVGANPSVVIKRTNTEKTHLMVECNYTLTVKDLVIDANNIKNDKPIFNLKGHGVFENVKVLNAGQCASVITLTNADKTLSVTDMTVADSDDMNKVNLPDNTTVTLNGNNNLAYNFQNGCTFQVAADGELTNEEPIELIPSDKYEYVDNFALVKNCNDFSKFDLKSTSYHLEANDGNLVLVSGDLSGISAVVADENAPVEYYNLQGIRVENPSNGIFIRRQGTKTTKVAL